jgi:hypothetical protein
MWYAIQDYTDSAEGNMSRVCEDTGVRIVNVAFTTNNEGVGEAGYGIQEKLAEVRRARREKRAPLTPKESTFVGSSESLEPDDHAAKGFGRLTSEETWVDMVRLAGALTVEEKDTLPEKDDSTLPKVISTVLSNHSIRGNALRENRHVATHVGNKSG